MTEPDLETQAINESVQITPYNPIWPAHFLSERNRLLAIAPELIVIEHIGSTAVPGLPSKPIIDLMAAVSSMNIADQLVTRLCNNGYITSPDFNRTLGDRRWLMRHAAGHRTHHLHLVLHNSQHWSDNLKFRDALRQDQSLATRYAALKQHLATQFASDREAYGDAKTAFIASAISQI